MLYVLMADLVVVIHVAFIVFVGGGSLLARRRPWLAWLHAPSLTWAVASITIGTPCPLTALEKLLRRLAGEGAYAGGFVDHYVEGVVYPASLTPLIQAMALTAIVVGYRSFYRRQRLASRDKLRYSIHLGPVTTSGHQHPTSVQGRREVNARELAR
jgi:hypothetical protein